MSIISTIEKINKELISAFAGLDGWFDQPAGFLASRPAAGGWSAREVLEHVILVNHYLLILIEKGSEKALRKFKAGDAPLLPNDYTLHHPLLEQVRNPAAFEWTAPAHVEPRGDVSMLDLRKDLRDQLYRCLCVMDVLPNGEGTLHTIQLSVNNIGRLDVYQYMYFLVLHIGRHQVQLQVLHQTLGQKVAANGVKG